MPTIPATPIMVLVALSILRAVALAMDEPPRMTTRADERGRGVAPPA